jgi:hypothetical protein
MKFNSSAAIAAALVLSFIAAPAMAQSQLQEEAVKQALIGQHMLVTYREGGTVYGTYYFRDVHFCSSGNYIVRGQSQKDTVLGNTQVNRLDDAGTWDVTTINGHVVLRSLSYSGRPSIVPITLMANGRIWLGEGVTVVSRGTAQCR